MAFKYKKCAISFIVAVCLIPLLFHDKGLNNEIGGSDSHKTRVQKYGLSQGKTELDGDVMEREKESENVKANAKNFGCSVEVRCSEGKTRKLPQVIFIGISKAGTG